jgi:hypothetical protein
VVGARPQDLDPVLHLLEGLLLLPASVANLLI